jgi:hypothetical protein
MLKTLYTVFLGILLAVFVGVGTSVFYVEPKAPESPVATMSKDPANFTAAEQKEQTDFEKAQRAWEKKEAVYSRNVSMIVMVFAVVLLALGFVTSKVFGFMAEGILFGGVFTLIYGLMRGMASDNSKYRFALISVCLVIAGVLGYLKFGKNLEAATAGAGKGKSKRK